MENNSSEISFEGYMVIIIVLAIFHVLVSGFSIIISARNKKYKKCGTWFVSFLLITAILILSAIAIAKSSEKFLEDNERYPKKRKC